MSVSQNPKQTQIIQTARALFWKYGMNRVSVEEICREAHISKMTFYKYFKNKNEVAIAILDAIKEEGMRKYQDIMSQNIPFVEKARLSIQLKMEQTEDLSSEFFNDLHRNADPEVKVYFQNMFQDSIQLILSDYLKAQKRGDIRKNIKPEFILYFLNHIVHMANDDQLASLYQSPQDMIMELTNFFFYGILPRGK